MRYTRYSVPTPEQAKEVLRLLRTGVTQAQAARQLHLSKNQVSKIKLGWEPKVTSVDLHSYKVDPKTGCHLWQGCLNKDGYGIYAYAGSQRAVHRVVWCIHNRVDIRTIRRSIQVIQVCEEKTCVNPLHLKKRHWSDRAKLCDADIRELRREWAGGATQVALQRKWGLAASTVWKIVHHVSWQHVK